MAVDPNAPKSITNTNLRLQGCIVYTGHCVNGAIIKIAGVKSVTRFCIKSQNHVVVITLREKKQCRLV